MSKILIIAEIAAGKVKKTTHSARSETRFKADWITRAGIRTVLPFGRKRIIACRLWRRNAPPYWTNISQISKLNM